MPSLTALLLLLASHINSCVLLRFALFVQITVNVSGRAERDKDRDSETGRDSKTDRDRKKDRGRQTVAAAAMSAVAVAASVGFSLSRCPFLMTLQSGSCQLPVAGCGFNLPAKSAKLANKQTIFNRAALKLS